MKAEPGDYEVLVSGKRSGGTYGDLGVAVDIASRLQRSNAPHVITVRSISTSAQVWPDLAGPTLAPN